MKLTQTTSIKRNSGMTLIELTVVIVVLLALIAVLFVGAKAYKKGADTAACVMNQRNIQQACLSYLNLNPSKVAADVTFGNLNGAELMVSAPFCPSDATAVFVIAPPADPETRWAVCPAAAFKADHVAADIKNW
jgi:type II secretory pathway pseudopilin PulG